MVLPKLLRDKFNERRHHFNVWRVEHRFLDLFHDIDGQDFHSANVKIDEFSKALKKSDPGDCVINDAVKRVLQEVFSNHMKDELRRHILLCTNVLVDKFDKNGWDQSAATLREKLTEEGAFVPQMQSKGSGAAFFHQGVVPPDEEVSTAPPEFSV